MAEQVNKWGPPLLYPNYIATAQVKLAVTLVRYLDSLGKRPDLTDASNLQAESTAIQNTIFLGAPHDYPTNHRVNEILSKTNFYIAKYEPGSIKNRNPHPRESVEYKDVDYSSQHHVYYDLIVFLPPAQNGARTLLFVGANVTPFTEVLATLEGLKLLDKKWSENGSPNAWEMVIRAEVNNGIVLSVTPKVVRVIDSNFGN